MGCRFCASTLDGLVRGLKPSEMLDQIYKIGKDIGERISNVVVMGTGEPMDNFDNLLKFIELLTDENGLNISQRNLTVSTCGIVPRLRELADRQLAITLALSLHASNQQKRLELMPVANKYDIHEVIDACRYYFEKTGRRVTFEYSLVGGVNDTDEDARELSRLIHGMNCHVNLIPVNPIKERNYVQSNAAVIAAFKNKLEKNGINVTIRREMGSDIDGACGQLRRSYVKADVAEISGLDLEEYFSVRKGELDLLSGGAPCQAFSYAGKKLGLEDARGTLFYHYATFLEKLQPKMFLFENVWCNCFYKMISALK